MVVVKNATSNIPLPPLSHETNRTIRIGRGKGGPEPKLTGPTTHTHTDTHPLLLQSCNSTSNTIP